MKTCHALYVYFMQGVKPDSEQPPETKLSFPFSQRWGMRFLELGVYFGQAVPADWRRVSGG